MARTRLPPPSLSARLGGLLNDLIQPFAPGLALRREAALQRRAMLRVMSGGPGPAMSGGGGHWTGSGRTTRGSDFRANNSDAVEAMRADRARMSWIAQDMLRNNPRVVKARRQIVNTIVGAGIQPSVRMTDPKDTVAKGKIEDLIRRHCRTRAVDADGKLSLFGLQGLAISTIVGPGEVLIRRRVRTTADGLVLPLQLQVMECDFLNEQIDGRLPNGNLAVQGIEFDLIGRRVAYHLYAEHPGSRAGASPATRRVPAENIIHAFDVVRPGQQRGMTWFAPVITLLHELQKYQDGQVKRQEIAALFAGIYKSEETADELEEALSALSPGAIMKIGSDEALEFTDPPTVEGYETFMRVTDRTIAGAMGITYEGFSGDYSDVSYTSGRMGRLDVDPNFLAWQNNLAIAQICDPIGGWLREAIADVAGIDPASWALDWTAPRRPVLDPTKDWPAYVKAKAAGFMSRRQIIRETGGDPDKVEAELIAERDWASKNRMLLEGDAATPPTDAADDGEDGNGDGRADDDNDDDKADDKNADDDAGGVNRPAGPSGRRSRRVAQARADAAALAEVLRGLPVPVVNVEVAAPQVSVAPAEVRAGDVHLTLPGRGAVVRTVTSYDAQGRIATMEERPAGEDGA